MKNILTAVKSGVLSGIRLMNDEKFYICINGKQCGSNGIVLCKIIFDDKEGHWKLNLLCTPVKVHNVDTDQLAFCDKKEVKLSMTDYLCSNQ